MLFSLLLKGLGATGNAVPPITKVDIVPATATLRNFMIARLFLLNLKKAMKKEKEYLREVGT